VVTRASCAQSPQLGEEPIEVSASIHSPDNDPRFKEVESTVRFTLRFPSGIIANCASSYSLHEHRNIRALGSKATAEIANAFGYQGMWRRIPRRLQPLTSCACVINAGTDFTALTDSDTSPWPTSSWLESCTVAPRYNLMSHMSRHT
jgi:predicted dehydrogenase